MTPPELDEPDLGPAVATSRGSLGEALKDLLYRVERSGRNVEVAVLARETKLRPRTVYAYLSGENVPPRGSLDSLLNVLNVSVAERDWLQDLREDVKRFPKPKKAGAADSGEPLIEIKLPDGSVRVAEIDEAADVPDDEKSLAGPYEIVELSEHAYVDAQRTIPRVDCHRKIRALATDVERFSYAFEGPPDSGLSRVVVESHNDAVVLQVVRVGRNSYVFHFTLPEVLDAGQTADISFSLFTFENPNTDPQNIYGKRQFVDTDKVELTVEFTDDGAPARVRWFAAAFPIGNFPDGYTFPPGNVIEPASGHRYEQTFSGIDLPQGRIVGIVWNY
ncbi:helix-turn-helix domain-containing protein [Kribbella sp. NPDC056951]|uniref:helix-turn-helix domain-containing protein n=1 Tax=Kribbella sp. NPDC056951 TaxID=3345978 RepID=UPI0036362918